LTRECAQYPAFNDGHNPRESSGVYFGSLTRLADRFHPLTPDTAEFPPLRTVV